MPTVAPAPGLGRADYGVDAPGMVRNFFVAAAVLGVAGFAAALLRPPWAWLASPLRFLAVAALLLGCSMLSYSVAGKQRLRDHLLRRRTWRGDETVLDVGAGRGLMAIGAAKLTPQGRVIALDTWSARDLSGNTADALRRNAARENVGVDIMTGDARRLDLPDASVDVVVSVFCLHNIEPKSDRTAACREVARVLKRGGTAMIADFPGARRYVAPLRAAGLTVDGPFRSELVALGISGYLLARK